MTEKVYNTAPNIGVIDLLPSRISSALDIGCGTGRLCQDLGRVAEYVDGLTFSEKEKELAARYCRKVWVQNVEDGLQQMTSTYEVVIMSHILEHIANPHKLMRDLMSVVSHGGVIVCAIPNMLFLYNRLKLFIGRVEYEEYGLMDYTHVRWYTRITLVELFEHYGFVLERFKANGNLPLGPLRRLLPRSTQWWLDETIVGWWPGLLARELVFRFKRV